MLLHEGGIIKKRETGVRENEVFGSGGAGVLLEIKHRGTLPLSYITFLKFWF